MEPEWRNKKVEIPSDVKAIYQDALQNNCWVYHTATRKFYTPQEFFDNWKSIYKEHKRYGSNEKELIIMNPMAAIRQRAKWVDIANRELQEVLVKLKNSSANWENV